MNSSDDAFPVYIDRHLLSEVESVLHKGESVAEFASDSLRRAIELRARDRDFLRRGLASREEANRTGVYFTTDDVLGKLDAALKSSKASEKKKR
jgi:hypothetical protein